jgi:hypothetical protein
MTHPLNTVDKRYSGVLVLSILGPRLQRLLGSSSTSDSIKLSDYRSRRLVRCKPLNINRAPCDQRGHPAPLRAPHASDCTKSSVNRTRRLRLDIEYDIATHAEQAAESCSLDCSK